MLDFLRLFVHVLFMPFRTQAQLEADITMLRHQLNVLRRQVPLKPKLTVRPSVGVAGAATGQTDGSSATLPASGARTKFDFSGVFGDHLADLYFEAFGRREAHYADMIREGAKLIFELLSGSDALYHDAEHTTFVTLVGQDILRGRRLKHDIQPNDWIHFTLATLVHDIGYARGVCRGDSDSAYVLNEEGEVTTLTRGASDASLTPYHIERSKIFVRERFALHPIIDIERVARAIELTRFPVPEDEMHQETDTEAGLVRAADLIGQLADPFYPRKLNALFHEFEEIGVNSKLGYKTAADIADHYPRLFWTKVEPSSAMR